MSTSTSAAFISYSRNDSEFALRLAQDLKAAGANVWLDQLDINPGSSWDNAIEDALTAAPRMLIVLSPASAKSENVRNEISFALDEGKVIIPVLYMDCTVPLRLQRTQRIDFRADYARGLAHLLHHLHVAHPDPEVLKKAAEGDAQRQAAWRARDLQEEKMKASDEQQGASRTGDAAPAVPASETQPRHPLLDSLIPLNCESTPPLPPRKSWWKSYTALFALAGVVAVLLIAARFHHAKAKAPALYYQQAVMADNSKDYAGAAKLYQQACSLGEAKACADLGSYYENGTGLEKDGNYAVALYDKACRLKDYAACGTLGSRYFDGDVVAQDSGEALQNDQKACIGSDWRGCAQLGILYATGKGVPKDSKMAVGLFQKACNGKDPLGCTALGFHYANGDGITQDMSKAAASYKIACVTDYASACTRLGDLYQAGNGVPQDALMAQKLFKKGCHWGDQKGCDALHPPSK